MKKLLNWLFSLVVALFIIIAVVTTILLLCTDDKGTINFGNYSLVIVDDNTMKPDINKNDLIINNSVSFTSLKVNDIVAYSKKINNETIIKTGKISSIGRNSSTQISLLVNDNKNESLEVTEGEYIGRWTYKKVLFLGIIFSFLLSKIGFLIGIILPLLLLFIYEISKITISTKKAKRHAKEESTMIDNSLDDSKSDLIENDTPNIIETVDNKEDILDDKNEESFVKDSEVLDDLTINTNNDVENKDGEDIEIL